LSVFCQCYFIQEINNFPFSSSISINDEAVHGFPTSKKFIEGDIVTIDIGIKLDKYYSDASYTYPIGEISYEKQRLRNACFTAMQNGIKTLVPGGSLKKTGRVIQESAFKNEFNVIKQFTGHGIGFNHHEDPYIINFFSKKNDIKLEKDMVLAIEPVLTSGCGEVFLSDNQWTYSTTDRKPAVQFEHTVHISDTGPVILTDWENLFR